MLTVDGKPHPASDKQAVIGTYGSTARQRITIRRSPNQVNSARGAIKTEAEFRQVNREANSLINELLIGTGSKDRFSVDDPKNDGHFANFFLDPLLAHIFASIGIPVPAAPRTDLLPLVQYMAPICPGCGPNDHGPIADLLRLNTGVPPTPAGSQKRLGFLAGDNAGFPNGRRLNDDVVDIAARVVAGVLVPDFNKVPNNLIGDGVNTSDVGFGTSFPYVLPAHSGRNSHHVAPGQAGCSGQAGGICPVN
jgi:hypothetical protein